MIDKENYNKELAHMVTETHQSQCAQGGFKLDPRIADGFTSVQLQMAASQEKLEV